MEVRKYPLGNYKNENLYILETKGNSKRARNFVSQIIGIIRFGQDFQYQDAKAFRADEHRHCIPERSALDWDPAKTPKLYGWVVANATLLPHPKPPPEVKGMIGAKATGRHATLPKNPMDAGRFG